VAHFRAVKIGVAGILALLSSAALFASAGLAADPTVTVEAPSNEIGDVGAARGNVWDMSSTSDISWTQPDASNRNIDYSVAAGQSGAYGSALRGEHPKGSDLASAFYTNSSLSIPGNIYRYFLYRAWIAPQQPGEGGRTPESTNGRVLYTTQWGTPDNWETLAYPDLGVIPNRILCTSSPMTAEYWEAANLENGAFISLI